MSIIRKLLGDPTIELLFVTPAMAEAMLKDCAMTSPLDRDRVSAFAEEMRLGRWRINGETIVLSPIGELLDGRERLTAAVESGVGFPVLVVRNVAKADTYTIDALHKRTHANIINIEAKIQGAAEGRGLALAAATELVYRVLENKVRACHKKLTPEAGKTLRTFFGLDLQYETVARVAPLFPLSRMLALYSLFRHVDLARAEAFIDAILAVSVDGAEDQHSAVSLLCGWMAATRDEGGVRNAVTVTAMIIKAWNAFVAGRQIKKLSFDNVRETFPRIDGLTITTAEIVKAERVRLAEMTAEEVTEFYLAMIESSNVTAQVETITPEMAGEMLDLNTTNRPISKPCAKNYGNDMRMGAWRVNGQTIKFSLDNVLLDGQHRLTGCYESGKPIRTIVVRNLDQSVFATLDQRKKRSASKALADRGIPYASGVSAALATLHRLENGQNWTQTVARPTVGVILQLLDRYSDMPGFVASAAQIGRLGISIPASLLAPLLYLSSRASRERRSYDDFVEVLGTGVPADGVGTDPLSHPAVVLRLRLARMERERTTGKLSTQVAIYIKAWNAYVQGRRITALAWRDGEDFPSFYGFDMASLNQAA